MNYRVHILCIVTECIKLSSAPRKSHILNYRNAELCRVIFIKLCAFLNFEISCSKGVFFLWEIIVQDAICTAP